MLRQSLQALDRDGRARAVTGRVAPIRGRYEVLGAVLVLSAGV